MYKKKKKTVSGPPPRQPTRWGWRCARADRTAGTLPSWSAPSRTAESCPGAGNCRKHTQSQYYTWWRWKTEQSAYRYQEETVWHMAAEAWINHYSLFLFKGCRYQWWRHFLKRRTSNSLQRASCLNSATITHISSCKICKYWHVTRDMYEICTLAWVVNVSMNIYEKVILFQTSLYFFFSPRKEQMSLFWYSLGV